MQFTLILASIISLGYAAAVPQENSATGICSGIAQPQCCAVDVESLADLDCKKPAAFETAEELKAVCAADGKSAHCCTVSVLGISLLCTAV